MIVNRKGEDMKFVIQRVNEASVAIEENVVGKINKGFLVFIGVSNADTKETADKMIKKLIGMRIFDDENGKTNLALADVEGELLLISQFTLYANCKKEIDHHLWMPVHRIWQMRCMNILLLNVGNRCQW